MKKTGGDVDEFVAGVRSARRRRDAETMIAVLRDVTGLEPEMWGTIVGFGSYHYRYPTGTQGDAPVSGFSPRAQATTIYLRSTEAHADLLSQLGPHKTGVGCLYIADLEAVDGDVLRQILDDDFRQMASEETPYGSITVDQSVRDAAGR